MADQDDLKPRRLEIDDESQRYPLEKLTRGGQRRRPAPTDGGGSGRLPPQAPDVEQAVLGAMLIEREAIPRAIEILAEDAFYSARHQRIFGAMLSLFERGNPVDLITLTEELKRRAELDEAGGPYYLTELTTRVASAANVEYHSRIIAEKSLLRKLIETMTSLIGRAYDPTSDAFDLLDQTESEVFRISSAGLRRPATSLKDVLKDTLTRLESIHGRSGGITGVPSGFTRLDDMTGGWQRSDLIIVAARPSMGKCLGKGTPILMFDGTVKPVEAVQAGDLLMGDDSTPRTVRSLARGRETMYRVRQRHGIDYRVNESHILSLRPAQGPQAVVNLSVREYLGRSEAWKAAHRGYRVAVDFPEQPLPQDPYVLGLELARVAAGAVTAGDAPDVPAEVPHAYLANSRANRLALLAGFVDGAPRTRRRHGAAFEIMAADARLAAQVKQVADTLGFRATLRPDRAAPGAFRLRLQGDLDALPTRVARRVHLSDERDWTLTPIAVEPDGEDEYYGFVLDGNHLFLLADGTVTHNTAFSLAMARNAALHPEHPAGVAIFSLEMSAQQLAQRLLTSEARVDAQAARTGRLRDEDWPRMARAAGRLSAAPIFIDDTPGLSVLELRAKCRRLKAEHDIGLVIVDYLQLMHGTGQGKNANREQEIAQISRSLKALAKEIDVPVIALSQLSRAVETRGGDKRPQLSDLRESGSIEQDADVVAFIYRAERYGITVDENGNSTEGIAEIIIGKQRNGPIGNVELAFAHQHARFENLSSYYSDSPQGQIDQGDGLSAPIPPPPPEDAPF